MFHILIKQIQLLPYHTNNILSQVWQMAENIYNDEEPDASSPEVDAPVP